MRWPASQAGAAVRTPVNCLVMEGASSATIAAYEKQGLAVFAPKQGPAVWVAGAKWPRVQVAGAGADASAGPTGTPWVDANGYVIQLAKAFNPGRPVWLDYGPPEGEQVSPDSMRLAMAEAATYGGRWVMRPEAAAVAGLVEFFEAKKAWRDLQPVANLAVMADFTGPKRGVAADALNLLVRRQLPFVVIPEGDFSRFRAVLCIGGATSAALERFEKAGGLVIRPSGNDPYNIAVETHLKLSRKNDLLRMWNAGSMNAYYTASADGGTHLVQVLNYAASNPSLPVSVGLTRVFRSARLFTLDKPAGQDLPLEKVRAGVEFRLPPFPVWAAIELKT